MGKNLEVVVVVAVAAAGAFDLFDWGVRGLGFGVGQPGGDEVLDIVHQSLVVAQSLVGSVISAASTVAWTVHQATPIAAATSSAARPDATTARRIAVRSRVRQRARVGSWSVAWVNGLFPDEGVASADVAVLG